MTLLARRPRVGRSRSAAALLVAALGCAVVLALTGWSRLAGTEPPARSSGSAAASVVSRPAAAYFTLIQMNLCLSGLADCYDVAAYPTVVREAVAQIRAMGLDAVTVNEACRGDVVRIARRTGYHVRFSLVIYGGERLPCPAGRSGAVRGRGAHPGHPSSRRRTGPSRHRAVWSSAGGRA